MTNIKGIIIDNMKNLNQQKVDELQAKKNWFLDNYHDYEEIDNFYFRKDFRSYKKELKENNEYIPEFEHAFHYDLATKKGILTGEEYKELV